MKTEIISASSPNAITHAVDVLRHGGLVAFPTDTVYGLASLPFKAEFVDKLYVAKGRNSHRAIAILLGDISQLPQITTGLSHAAELLAKHFWPGPLTLVVLRRPSLPDVLSADPTIGVRMPNHPVALALLEKAGPLAVTSANLSGKDNASTAQEVAAQLGGRIHLILDGGAVPGGVPSTVVDCTTSGLEILRPGPITAEEIQRALG